MSQERISIVVSVYNLEALLPRCLETISNQTYQNLEIILVDDGSTDESGVICDKFAKRDNRTIVIHQENRGVASARNTGKQISSGKYIMFVDGDDYLHKDAIRILYETINMDQGYEIALFDRKETHNLDEDILSEESCTTTTILSTDNLIEYMFNYREANLFVYCWNKLYRSDLIKDIDFKDFSRGEDFDFNFRVYLKTSKAIWVHRVLYFYVQRSDSLTRQIGAHEESRRNQLDFLFQNYMSLPANKKHLGHFLLERIYSIMIRQKEESHNEKEETLRRLIDKTIRSNYWRNRQIGLLNKIAVMTHYHFPGFVNYIKRLTNNRIHWPFEI